VLVGLCVSLFFVGADAKNITLQYWSWDSSVKKQNEEIIAKFEAENPGVKVELTTLETTEYWVKLRLLGNQGKLPDVFNMSSGIEGEKKKSNLAYL